MLMRPHRKDVNPDHHELDAYDRYYNDVSKLSLVDSKTERQLLVKYKRHKDLEAREKLLNANLRFVVKLARRFCNNNGDLLMDLISAGNLGLIKALEHFDIRRTTRFLTYATSWVLLEIRCELRNADIVSMPVWRRKAIRQIKRICDSIAAKEGRHAELSELEKEVGLSQARLKNLEVTQLQYVPEEACDGPNAGQVPTAPSPDEHIMQQQRRAIIESIIRVLPAREQPIICNYYGLSYNLPGLKGKRSSTMYTNAPGWSLKKIGRYLSVSSERVRQIKVEALDRVKGYLDFMGIHNPEDINSSP